MAARQDGRDTRFLVDLTPSYEMDVLQVVSRAADLLHHQDVDAASVYLRAARLALALATANNPDLVDGLPFTELPFVYRKEKAA